MLNALQRRTGGLNSRSAGYLLALAVTALALLLRWALDAMLGNSSQYLLFYFTVMFVAVTRGTGPALLAIALGAIAGTWFFIAEGRLAEQWSDDAFRLGAFLAFGGLTTWLAGRLHRATQQWQRTFDSVPDLIAILDNQHRVVQANRALARRLAALGTPGLGLKCYQCLHGLDRPPESCPHSQTLRDGREHAAEVHEPRLGGDFLVSTTPLHDGRGRLVGTVHVARDISERKRMEAALRELNASLEGQVAQRTAELRRRHDQLQALSAELNQVEQRERQRFARLLHDGLQQVLVAARMRLASACAPGGGRAARDQIDALLAECLDLSRDLTVQLAPPVLGERGLIPALHWLARRMHQQHELEVEVAADPAAEPPAEAVRLVLFQAARELLFNAAKHAGVRRATLALRRRADHVCLEVADQGRGFDPAFPNDSADGATGLGLPSIRQRVEWLGGEMEIHSAPGQGTRVTLALKRG